MSEEIAREALKQYLASRGSSPEYIERQLLDLCNTDNFEPRFQYMESFFSAEHKERLLVSGASVGTELLVGLQHNFAHVSGTEVQKELVDICNARFAENPAVDARYYDGSTLPFEDSTFTAVVSGHIIEHTPNPEAYLAEHLRVLKPGGRCFLEFPSRYHTRELHTGMISFEWLPVPLRDWWLRFLESPLAPISPENRINYHTIRVTLRPISVGLIRRWLRRAKGEYTLLDHAEPAPGFVRMVFEKRG